MQLQIGEHQIEFDYGYYVTYLWLGILFVLIWRLAGYLAQKSLRDDYSNPTSLSRTTRGLTLTGLLFSTGAWCLVAALLSLALAQPFESNQQIEVPAGSVHYVFAFDVSPSADAEDYRDSIPPPVQPDGTRPTPIGPWGSRLHAARWIAHNKIMKAMPGNKAGLVAYTADARVVSLLREDSQVILEMLNSDEALTAPGGGSDPADGLKAAVQILRKQYDAKKRQIIFIFTDGGISDLESKTSKEDKDIWERDFKRTLKELEGLRDQSAKDGLEPPKVVLVGVGGDQEVMVPLYYTTGERVRDEKGAPDFFPYGEPPDKKQKTKYEEANVLMLKQRIEAVVPCQYLRVSQDWTEVDKQNWVENVIGGKKTAVGKRYLAVYPLSLAMGLIVLLFARGLFRGSDVIARRRGLPQR